MNILINKFNLNFFSCVEKNYNKVRGQEDVSVSDSIHTHYTMCLYLLIVKLGLESNECFSYAFSISIRENKNN